MSTKAKAPRRGRWRRRALIGLGAVAVAVPALWVAIHEIPGFGPALADGVRAVVGPGPVAWAEDVAYGVADEWNCWRYQDAAPKTFWEAPSGAVAAGPAAVPVAASGGASAGPAPARDPAEVFPPAPFEPPYRNVAGAGDGQWLPMPDAVRPGEPIMFKAVVHPDPKRSFAAIAVVAIDLRKMDLVLVAGTSEPQSMTVPKEHRPGLVPADRAADLVAVFNGGFKAMHGHYGMMIEGETFVVPRDIACTFAFYQGGGLKIGTWSGLKASEPEMRAYRQTPPCLVEDGEINKALHWDEYNKSWGAAVGGETIIRRSAIALDASGQVLFYGLGEAMTAQALARGMKAVGAYGAAQLDVNYSYPRFLTYERKNPGEPPRATAALIPDIKFTSYEYAIEPSPRDFFYLARRREKSALNP